MAYILPERLLALVRPAFDLVLRRIRSLKRCVQACGCKIMTPRYAVWQNAQQLQGPLKRKPWLAFWLAAGLAWVLAGFLAGLAWLLAGFLAGFLAGLAWLLAGFLAGLVWLLAGFLAGLAWLLAGFAWLLAGFLAGLAWLSFFSCFFSSPCRNAAAGHFASISRVIICSHTPARSVLDFESFAGRGQMLDGRVPGASQVEYKPFGKPPLKREEAGCAY